MKSNLGLPVCRVLFVALACFAGLLPVHAQNLPDQQELRRQAQEQEQERLKRLAEPRVELQPPAFDAGLSLPDELPCFELRALRIKGEHVEQFPWLAEAATQVAGRCVGKAGLNVIVRWLTASLVDRGYITTRIGIPEQNLASGELLLRLVPGKIASIRLAEGSPDIAWRTAFPMRPGDLLNLRDLEQGLEQLKRVPSQDVDFEILPGKEAGQSDIVIKVQRGKPWRISVAADDAGSRATGRYQASLSASLDDPLGINDLLSITTNSDAQRDRDELGSRGNSASYSVPYGYWLFTGNASRSRYHQTVAGANQAFVSSGKNEQFDLKIHRTLHRDQSSKTGGYVRIIKRKSRSYIDDTEIEVQRRNSTALELALNRRQYFGRALFDLTLGYKEGSAWFNGQTDPADRPLDAPSHEYQLQFVDLSASVPFSIATLPVRWSSAIRGQATSSRLYGSEMFSIGGRYTVRGFDGETSLTAECGWYWRNELEAPLAGSGQSLFIAYDYGEVSGPSAAHLAGQTLAGVALGLRGGWQGLSYDFFAAWPVQRPENFRTAQPSVGFQTSYQY